MSPQQQRFGHYLIAHQASGGAVELERSKSEVVFLAFDSRIKRLVELHILNKGHPMDAAPRRSALDRIEQAMELRGLSFMRVIEHGDESGAIYFATNLNDGEPIEDYVARRGAVPAVTAFCLMQQYLDDLVAARKFDRLLSFMKVGSPLVTTNEDAFLQLRIVDYGLSEAETMNDEMRTRRVVAECGQLLFTLLTGQPYEGQNPDRFPALTSLPTNLRTLLRTALLDADNVSPVLEKLRDDVKEAYGTLVTSLQVRSSRKHLILTDSLQPTSHIQQLLLENVPIAELLKGRYDVANGEDIKRYPFCIPAVNANNRQPVNVHLLPPSRIVDKSQYDAVPLQMWRFNKDSHPNILRSLSLWETPDWTFLTEEREPGFTVSRLLAERVTLNPTEVALILRQVKAGLEQASECGVHTVDVHPSNLLLKVGRDGVIQSREAERLMQKRLDAWPPFILKVRTHATMRALYEPQLVEPVGGDGQDVTFFTEKDFRNRSFVALAVYLLTGDRQVGQALEFGETVPEALSAFLKEVVQAGRSPGATPAPGDFLSEFELHMVPPNAEGRGFAAIRAAGDLPAEEMESVGSVSDFEEDWSSDEDGPNYLMDKNSRVSLGMTSLPKSSRSMSRGSMGMFMWALGAVVLLCIAYFTLTGGGNASTHVQVDAAGDTVHSAAYDSTTGGNVQSSGVDARERETGGAVSPGPSPKKSGPKGPEEIKKAILPKAWELESLKRSQGSVNPMSLGPDSAAGVQGKVAEVGGGGL